MEIEKFSDMLKEKGKQINIDINNEQIEKFHKYMEMLVEWNERMNLTAITEPVDIIDKHFIDSITIEKYLKKGAKVIDVGTGAGFPGVPLGIIREDLNITLMDSLNKRINFLDEVIRVNKLLNIDTVHSRAEELSRVSIFVSASDNVANGFAAVPSAFYGPCHSRTDIYPLCHSSGGGGYVPDQVPLLLRRVRFTGRHGKFY